MNFVNYNKDIEFLESLTNLPTKNNRLGSLLRMKNFLQLLGNPQAKLKFIHVAGTSGKGTVVNLLHELITDARLKTGSYTSPFASTSIEKIKVKDKLIAPTDLHQILENKIKPALDKYLLKYPTTQLTYFEVFLSLALVYFQQQKCNWVIIEASMGGKFDDTNIIPNPKATAITNVGLDHTDILGKTKKLIAQDKAGIIKPKSKFFTNETNLKLVNLFKRVCQKQSAKFITLKTLNNLKLTNTYFGTSQQQKNLNLVLNILDSLKIKPTNPQAVINKFQLPCRQEIIQTNPKVILDGAHNFDKIKNLIEFIKQQKYNKLHLILGLSDSKDYKNALKKLLPLVSNLYLTRFLITFRKSADLRQLYNDCLKIKKIPTEIYHDPNLALKSALKLAKKDDLIVVAGSFFLAGELRKHWVSAEKILTKLKIS